MAEQLDDSFSLRPRGCQDGQYPWDEWLNGKPWLLTKDEDFSVEPESFRTTASAAGRRKGFHMRIHKVSETQLIIQAFPQTGTS